MGKHVEQYRPSQKFLKQEKELQEQFNKDCEGILMRLEDEEILNVNEILNPKNIANSFWREDWKILVESVYSFLKAPKVFRSAITISTQKLKDSLSALDESNMPDEYKYSFRMSDLIAILFIADLAFPQLSFTDPLDFIAYLEYTVERLHKYCTAKRQELEIKAKPEMLSLKEKFDKELQQLLAIDRETYGNKNLAPVK